MNKFSAITNSLLHQDTLIGSVLSHFHSVEEAKKLGKLISTADPIVSLGQKIEGRIVYGQEIAANCLEHVRIRVNPAEADPYRYFRRVSACDGTKVKAGSGHGLSASAWAEIDAHGAVKLNEAGKCDLRVCYPGYTEKLVKTEPTQPKSILRRINNAFEASAELLEPTSAQTKSMLSSLHGEFLQAQEVGAFLDKTMGAAKAMELPPIGNVINSSWSLGAANALTSNLYFKIRHPDIPSSAILGDPWRASAAVNNIPQRAGIIRPLFGGSRTDAMRPQAELRSMMTSDVTSVYPALQDQAGAWTLASGTAPGAAKFPVIKRIFEPIGATPFGQPVGQVFHLDAKDMTVLEPLAGLGNTHHRTNIINHLATHDGILHAAPQVAAAKGAGHGVV